MKKKIAIALLLCIPFVSILLVVIFRGMFMPTNEEIIKDLKQIECYETEVEYIMKNSRGEEREDTKQYFSKTNGVRVEFGEDRVKIYKKDGIKVIDNISKSEYVIDNSMDIVHSLAFVNKILSFPVKGDTLTEGQEEWGDKIYIQADIELFLNNNYFNTARIFIDKKEKSPIGIIIYDKNGDDTVRIVYTDFKRVKQIDESLL